MLLWDYFRDSKHLPLFQVSLKLVCDKMVKSNAVKCSSTPLGNKNKKDMQLRETLGSHHQLVTPRIFTARQSPGRSLGKIELEFSFILSCIHSTSVYRGLLWEAFGGFSDTRGNRNKAYGSLRR